MQPHEILCKAIAEMKLVQFYYDGGTRVVEPHMVAQNQQDHYALSAWFLRGFSRENEGQGWKQYLLREIQNVEILDEKFAGPRPGYKSRGGKVYHRVVCSLPAST